MKFNQLRAFQKHLEQAAPNHLCETYFIFDPEVYGQRKWSKLITHYLSSYQTFQGSEITVKELHSLLEGRSLFDPTQNGLIYEADRMPKPLFKTLLKAVESPHTDLRLILTFSSVGAFYTKLAKKVVAFDLTAEKPWDKQARLVQYVTDQLKNEHLNISSALASQLVHKCNHQLSFLDQEIEKLICYLHGKKEAQRSDLELIQLPSEASAFKVAEALVQGNLKEALHLLHRSSFQTIPLIYALRSVFQRSLRLKELSKQEAELQFPKLRGKWLEKMLISVQPCSKAYLKKALITLYELEIRYKNHSISDALVQSLSLLKLGAIK